MIKEVLTSGDPFGARQLFGMTKRRNKEGKFIIFGGYDHKKKFHYNSLMSYNPENRKFEKIQDRDDGCKFEKIREATVNFKFNFEVLIYGGKIDCKLYTGKNSSDVLYSFNLETKKLKKLKSKLPFIAGHASLYWSKKDSLVVYGGWDSMKNECQDCILVHSLKTLDLRRISFKKGMQPKSRSLHSMEWFTDSSFLIFGGFGKEYYSDIWVFNLSNKRWREIKPKNSSKIPRGRCGNGSNFYGKKLFISGGFNETYKQLDDFWYFDFETLTWKEIKIKNMFPLSYHQMGFKEMEDEGEIEREEEENEKIVFFCIGGATRKNKTLNIVHEIEMVL